MACRFRKPEHRSLNQQIEFILEHFLSDKAHEPPNEQLREGRQRKTRTDDG